MSNKYEYPEGSSAEKKYSMLSKEGRTESLIPQFLKEPKSLMMIILVGGLFYMVTHLLSYTLGDRNKSQEKSDSLVVKQSQQKISEIASKIQQDSNFTNKKLNNFSAKVSDLSVGSEKNSVKISESRQKISQLESELSTTKAGIAAMKADMTALKKSLEALKPKKQQPTKIVKKQAPVIKEHYLVRAMVHGRAWIYSKSGKYKTVKVGDTIKTYGKVTYLNEALGLINTSSGRDITYD